MFDELEEYRNKGHFLFNATDSLADICNAPDDKSGVYVVYALRNGNIDMIYIGSSGKKKKDGLLVVSDGGLKSTIVNGPRAQKIPRNVSWIKKINAEKIQTLDIYWYAMDAEAGDACPEEIKNRLLRIYFNLYGRMPRWMQ